MDNLSQPHSEVGSQGTTLSSRRSRVWEVFALDGTSAICGADGCGRRFVVPKGGSTNSLWKHLLRAHGDLYR